MQPAHEPTAMDRLERAEGEVNRLTGDIASLIQLGHQHQQQLQRQQEQLAQVIEKLTSLATPAPPPQPEPNAPPPDAPAPVATPPDPAAPEPKIGNPERFDGDPKQVRAFLTSCRVQFSLQPRTFATERARVGYVITHLTGRARLWGAAEFERRTPACATFEAFAAEMTKVFDLGSSSSEASRELLTMRQGNRTVADYSIDFRTQVNRSSWNMAAVVDAFYQSLADYIKDELVSHDLPSTLDAAIELAARIDHRIQIRRRERGRQNQSATRSRSTPSAFLPSPVTPPTQSNQPEPMEIGRASLTPEERQRRFTSNLCLYCGGDNHRVASCPAKARAHQV